MRKNKMEEGKMLIMMLIIIIIGLLYLKIAIDHF